MPNNITVTTPPPIVVQTKGGKSSVTISPTGGATRLIQLSDVDATPRSNGDVLTYISANGQFEFHPQTGGSGSGVAVAAQLSSNISQIPSTTGATLVTFDEVTLLENMALEAVGTRLTANSSGLYLIVVGGQVGRTLGGGEGIRMIDMWFRKNGTAIPDSGVRQILADVGYSDVLVNNLAIELLAGDYIEVMQAVETTGLGMGLIQPPTPLGSGPNIPSVILSAVRVASIASGSVTTNAVAGHISSNASQFPANTDPYVIAFDANEVAQGITHVVGNTRITVDTAGLYLIIAEGQVGRTLGGGEGVKTLDLWLRVNGVDSANTAKRVALDDVGSQLSYVDVHILELAASDYIEMVQAVETAGLGMGVVRVDSLGGPDGFSIGLTLSKLQGVDGALDQYARDVANGAFTKANSAIFTSAQIRANVSNTAPINYDAITGIISHADSGATATTYGNTTFVPVITLDAKGHIIAVTNTAIAGTSGTDQFARDQANAAFTQANTANTVAASAYAQANIATTNADAAFVRANSATVTGQAGFDHANGAFTRANTANTVAASAYAQANIATTNADAAFLKANGAIYTAAQIRANLSNTAPINYDATTGIISHADSGASATTYGNTTFVPTITVDAKGHVTSVSNTAINFPPSGVTSVAGKTGAVLLDTYDIAENLASNLWFTAARVRANVSNTTPINYDPSTGTFSHALSGVVATGHGDGATVPKIVVDDKGHVTSVTNTAIAISATAITSGTLAVTRGGTGQTAITVNGSLLIGNTVSGGFDVNPLTQGTGILITNDKGAITIAATGGSSTDQFARDQANAAFNRANTANTVAASAYAQANIATTNADAAFTQANAAYANANTAIYTASQIRANLSNTAPINYDATTGVISHALSGVTATTYGNTTFVPTITVDDKGHVTAIVNTAIALPPSTDEFARAHANAAFDRANTANTVAASAYNQANISTTNADAAFLKANGAVQSGFVTLNVSSYNVGGYRDIVAESNTDTLTLRGGRGILLTTNANNDILTINSSSDLTVSLASANVAITNWTVDVVTPDEGWLSVAWSPELGMFAAVNDTNTTSGQVMTSPDGLEWTARTGITGGWYDITWADTLGLFVAVSGNYGYGVGNQIMTSANGITWTARTAVSNQEWTGITWSPQLSLLVAVASNYGTGDQVMTSPDGITWTARTAASNNNWYKVIWSPELSLFAAVAYTGTNRVMTSPDGITWTGRAEAEALSWQDITWSSKLGLFVAVGYAGTNRVMTSPDGVTWTSRTCPTGIWTNVVWIAELSAFAAVGTGAYSNSVLLSPDGITWTEHNIGMSSAMTVTDVVWSPELGSLITIYYNGTGDQVSVSRKVGLWRTIETAKLQADAAFARANAAYANANTAIYTSGQIRANLSNTAPINYDAATGIISHADSGVVAAGHGDAATIPKITVNAKGHVTSVTNTSIAIAASQITSGTLSVARGGTGQTAITVNGSLLIGNTVSGGFDVNALTQGTGILITNDKGSITIAATGGSSTDQYARDIANGAAQNAFVTINVAGQSDIVADSNTDTLTLVAGNGMILTTNSVSDTITISANLSLLGEPVGAIEWHAGAVQHNNYLHANGALVSRTTYAELFAEIGDDYGSGDGSTTFVLPDVHPTFPAWVVANTYPELVERHTVNVLPDNRILTIGGINSGVGSTTANVYFGNVTGNNIVWTPASNNLPSARSLHTSHILQDGRVLVVGGRDSGGGLVSTTYFGNISGTTIVWTSGTALNVATSDHSSSLLPDGRLVVTGGTTTATNTEFGNISGTTITWTAGTALPLERRFHTQHTDAFGRVIIVGGRDIAGTIGNQVYFGDVVGTTVTWRVGTPLPLTRSDHAGVIFLQNKLFIVGGVTTATTVVPYMGIVDGGTNITWKEEQQIPTLTGLRTHSRLGVLANNDLVLVGGSDGISASQNTVFIGSPLMPMIRTNAIAQIVIGTYSAEDQFARDQANAAFNKANTANVTGQAAFDKANAVGSSAYSSGAGQLYYPDTSILVAPASNFILNTIPTGNTEVMLSAEVNGNTTFIARFIANSAINDNGVVDGGEWMFDTFANVSSTVGTGTSYLVYRINLRVPQTGTITSTGSGTTRTFTVYNGSGSTFDSSMASADITVAGVIETNTGAFFISTFTDATHVDAVKDNNYATWANVDNVTFALYRTLFTPVTGSELTDTPINDTQLLVTSPFVANTTDSLVAAYFARSTEVSQRTVNMFVQGQTRYSHFHTPMAIRHNRIVGVQGGTPTANGMGEYYHLTNSEYINLPITYTRVNNAYAMANTANVTGQAAFDHANGAFTRANTANTVAAAAYTQANIATTNADAAFAQANAAYANANTAIYTATQIRANISNAYPVYYNATTGVISFVPATANGQTLIGNTVSGTFDVALIAQTAPVIVTNGKGTVTLSHASSGVVATGYGTPTQIPVFIVDAFGHITSVTNTAISGLDAGVITTGTLVVARGGTGQSSYTNGQILIGNTGSTGLDKATIAQSAPVIVTVAQGSITISHARSGVVETGYGDAASIPVFVVDANGHITSVTNTSIAISTTAITSGILSVARGGTGKDATGLANGQLLIGNTVNTGFDLTTIAQTAPVIVTNGKGTITLSHASSGVTATGYGTAALVPVFVVDAFGHITSVTNTSIAIAASAITSGTLVVARGGTGQSSYTNGQILIGNTGSTGLDVGVIAQSAPVIVTVAQGSITISHARSGVTATGYGDAASIPVFVVDANGHITSVTNTAVALAASAVTSGILSVARGGTGKDATGLVNGQILIANTVNTGFDLAGVTQTAPIIVSTDKGSIRVSHARSGVTATTYGSASLIPVLTIDDNGHITTATTAAASGLPAATANGQTLIGNTVSGSFDVALIAQTAPIIVTNGKGTITLSHASSGVTATGYGDAATIPVFVVDAFGHITGVTNTAVAISASAITSGTLVQGRGGTGFTGASANGQTLIGNTVSGGFDLATLSAGTGIAINNLKGSIEIVATGGSSTDQYARDKANGAVQTGFTIIAVAGQSDVVPDSNTDTLTLVGSGITITTDAGTDTITFTSAGGGGNGFGIIQVTSGGVAQANVYAEGANTPLKLIGGNNITLTSDDSANSVTISAPIAGLSYAISVGYAVLY